MRRWLVFMLLFVLPVQFSWSVAAAYCQHEQAPTTPHIGHHVHVHKEDGDAASKHTAKKLGDSGNAGKLVGDNDCGYCQLSMAKSMIPVVKQPSSVASPLVIAAPPQAFQSRGPDRIERPQWLLA
jgi:hypothetical protein